MGAIEPRFLVGEVQYERLRWLRLAKIWLFHSIPVADEDREFPAL
jgi:hypothetical protein